MPRSPSVQKAALHELAGVKGRLTKCRADLQAAVDVDKVPARPGWQGLATKENNLTQDR